MVDARESERGATQDAVYRYMYLDPGPWSFPGRTAATSPPPSPPSSLLCDRPRCVVTGCATLCSGSHRSRALHSVDIVGWYCTKDGVGGRSGGPHAEKATWSGSYIHVFPRICFEMGRNTGHLVKACMQLAGFNNRSRSKISAM